MRILVLFIFLLVGTMGFSQNGHITQEKFIEIEMGKVERHLKSSNSLQLSNQQKVDLSALFVDKYARVSKSWKSGLTKLEMSQQSKAIEDEYAPQIESLLTHQQRLAILETMKGQKTN